MNRRTLFTGIAGGAVILAVLAGGGVAVAVAMGQNPPDDSGPTDVAASTRPTVTATPDPGSTAIPGSLPIADRLRPWKPGDRLVTEQEFRDFHATLPTADVLGPSYERLLEGNLYAVDCMKTAGFYWDPRTDPRDGPGLNDFSTVEPAALTALRGSTQTGAYDWHLGGCDGVGAHLAGEDGTAGVPGTVFPGYSGPGAG